MERENYSKIIFIFQILAMISMPVFFLIYKTKFLFFTPIFLFIILALRYIRKRIVEEKSDQEIIDLVFGIARWLVFLVTLELIIFFALRYSATGTL